MSDSEEVVAPAAEDTPAPAPAEPAAAKKKKSTKSKSKKPASHPKFREMTVDAIIALKERSGSSRQAILKYITANYKVDSSSANNHLKMTLKAGVKNGTFKQCKGTGASGSFRIGEKGKEKSAKKAKKPAADKKPKAEKKKTAKPKKTKAKVEKKAKPAKSSPKKKAAKPKKTKSPKKAASKAKGKKGKAAKK